MGLSLERVADLLIDEKVGWTVLECRVCVSRSSMERFMRLKGGVVVGNEDDGAVDPGADRCGAAGCEQAEGGSAV
jgi:hypothetical protein